MDRTVGSSVFNVELVDFINDGLFCCIHFSLIRIR